MRRQMKRNLLPLFLLLASSGCDSQKSAARRELEKLNIPWSSEAFIDRIKTGDMVLSVVTSSRKAVSEPDSAYWVSNCWLSVIALHY